MDGVVPPQPNLNSFCIIYLSPPILKGESDLVFFSLLLFTLKSEDPYASRTESVLSIPHIDKHNRSW